MNSRSDLPELTEDWQHLFMGQVDAKIAARKDTRKPYRDFKARIPLSAAPVLGAAAAQREMSVGAYIRRACLAFAAFDLDLDLAQVLIDEPETRRQYDGAFRDKAEAGQGHGNWVIEGLK